MGRRIARDGRPIRLSVSECAVRLSADTFRREFLKIGRIELMVFDVIWREGVPGFFGVQPDLPPTRELLGNPGYVGQVTLIPDECGLYTRAPRWYFSCGGCGRRRGRIYASHVGAQFLCGPCLNVTYPSAQRWDNEKRTGWPAGLRGRASKRGGGTPRRFWQALTDVE